MKKNLFDTLTTLLFLIIGAGYVTICSFIILPLFFMIMKLQINVAQKWVLFLGLMVLVSIINLILTNITVDAILSFFFNRNSNGIYMTELDSGLVMEYKRKNRKWEYVTTFDSSGRLMMLFDRNGSWQWEYVAHDEG